MQPWFELYPDILEREKEAFAKANIKADLDQESLAAGVVRFDLLYPAASGELRLVATYPDFFPFFRPEVSAPDLNLDRHQHPLGGNLCLIGRRTSNWFTNEPLAEVLQEQLPHLLSYGETGDRKALEAVEEAQGEPASVYYNSVAVPDAYLLIDSAWTLDSTVKAGKFYARCKVLKRTERPFLTVQGYVERVEAEDGTELARWQGPRPSEFGTPLVGTWVRLDEPVLGGIDVFKEKIGAEQWASIFKDPLGALNAHLRLGAAVYPEEVIHKEIADGWAFFGFDVPAAKKGRERKVLSTFIATARAGQTDLAARVPATAAFHGKRVAVFGVGAVGSPIAVELARAGVKELNLIDADRMEPSTARRWEVGWPAFNRSKVEILAERISSDYPWTQVTPYSIKIGSVDEPEIERQGEVVERILSGIHLVIDATAEMGVNHFLSELCRARGILYLLASSTPGAWGGTVAWFSPDTPCWMCMRHGMYETNQIPLPPADMDQTGEIQPPGCAEPTFTGAAFDLREVSLQAVRTASEILSKKPAIEDVPQLQLLSLRSDDGNRTGPSWTSETIPRNGECKCSQ